MNSRFLALTVLGFFLTGCAQLETINSPPLAETTQAEPAPLEPVPVPVPVQDQDSPPPGVEPVPRMVIIEPVQAPEPVIEPEPQPEIHTPGIVALCNEVGNKLGSVSVEDCLAQPLAFAGAYTVQGRPLAVRDFLAAAGARKQPRILILGGIHGDEYSSISIMFRWMELLEKSENRDFHWRFVPTVNPDGLLDGQAIRQNANGVDLNRNFPSRDWQDLAEDYWANITNRNPRRYPGSHPASEPEVQWVVDQISSYKPDVIVSVHAPYHLLDYDGPPEPPQRIGELHLHLLGVYPGSLGNYAGIDLGIPVVTMELPSAGIMPPSEQIQSMWNDLLVWLYKHHESESPGLAYNPDF